MKILHGLNLSGLRLLAVLAVGGMLAGCATSHESRYFMLAGASPAAMPATQPAAMAGLTVLLRPVVIPAYLDRPQIVTRLAEHEITASEFNRWGMPLENSITALLADVLTAELPGMFIETATMPPRQTDGMQAQVHVEITRLDGALGGEVSLMARWSIQHTGQSAVARHAGTFHQKAAGAGYDAYVQAINAAVEQSGRAIAAGLRGLAAAE